MQVMWLEPHYFLDPFRDLFGVIYLFSFERSALSEPNGLTR